MNKRRNVASENIFQIKSETKKPGSRALLDFIVVPLQDSFLIFCHVPQSHTKSKITLTPPTFSSLIQTI